MAEELRVGFIGNPNCGKTTLFNAYTGAKLKVANWPGVTVEKKEGAMKYHKHRFNLVDLPGIYSMTSYTMEEKVSRQFILSPDVDVIVDVADASALERNLYLTLQLIELGKPVILALNMMDIVQERGMEIDLHRLPEMLGIPCIPVSARKRTGLQILMHTIAHHEEKRKAVLEHQHPDAKKSLHRHNHHEEYTVVYDDVIEDKIDEIVERMKASGYECENYRWYAIKLLEMDEEICEKVNLDFSDIVDRSYEADIINQKYDFIEEIIEECLVNKSQKAEKTDRIDRVLTHSIWGIPAFLMIMTVVFFLTFTIGDWLKGYLETGLSYLTEWVRAGLVALNTSDVLVRLITDGILTGVGGILTFLPNIFILFLALAFLEDSGYMARAAYVMDGLMGHLGLSGRAFIPMILGFGCTVPAVMASRALEHKSDRRKTILITPFMSCSARLPVYVLFSELFFGKYAMFVAFSMYVLGMVVAVLTALVLNRIEKSRNRKSKTGLSGNRVNAVGNNLNSHNQNSVYKADEGETEAEAEAEGDSLNALLIELPEYKTPNASTICIFVWEKVKDYLTKAGTTIFIASILVWFVLNFGPHGMVDDMAESFGAMVGKALVPVMAVAGLGMWQVVVALISGIAAKEVVVSSFTVLFGMGNLAAGGKAAMVETLAQYGFGAANALAMMVFVLLYTPCIATISVMNRELESKKYTLFAVLYQVGVAWVLATVVYRLAVLF